MKKNILLIGSLLSLSLLSFISGETKSSQESENTKSKWGRHSESAPVPGGIVKITARGSQDGDVCRNDRSFEFEDVPAGINILWDPGRTVDETYPGLGKVDVILLSSTHGDHLGDARINRASPGTCGAPTTISAAPNPTTATIAAAKNSAVFAGGEMGDYLGRKIQTLRGVPTPSCAASGIDNELTVPLNSPCVGTLRPGGSRTVKRAGIPWGVRIANVPAFHSNGIPSAFVDAPGVAPGTTAYGGNDGGAIIQFSNGLTVYLSADTGLSGDMESIIRAYYQPELVVLNIGDMFCLGPEEGAYAINSLIKPRTVIPSHINEAGTTGGVVTGQRLKRFLQLVDRRTAVEIPLSGVTLEFDGRGRRVNK